MNITFSPITAVELRSFYATYSGEKTFLQDEKYGTFCAEKGQHTFRFGAYAANILVGTVQLQKVVARRGTYLICPHGPLLAAGHSTEAFPAFLIWLKAFGKEQKCDFVRVSPLHPKATSEPANTLFNGAGYVDAVPYMINPERTLVLDLTPPMEDILAGMKKSTRYEVRRIEKCGISTTMGNDAAALDTFWALHAATVSRKAFTPFSRKSTELELEVFGNDVQIFTAWLDGKPMASSVIVFDGDAMYYHQGASEWSKLPVAHATLWAAMEYAKARGCTKCNFWGLSEAENKKHPWYGLSRFKRGFGGTEHEFMHAQDAGLTWKYGLTRFIEKRERRRRGY